MITAATIGYPQPLNVMISADQYCLRYQGTWSLYAGQTTTLTLDASQCGSSSGTLTVTVAGLYTSHSVSIPLTVIDDTPPQFYSSSPPDGAIVSGITTFSSFVNDPSNPVLSSISVDGVPAGQGSGYLQVIYDSRQLPDGPHIISFDAADGGNLASQASYVTVLNSPASHDLALNGGFENVQPSGSLVGWTTGGSKSPVRSPSAHSGAWALGLGTQSGSGSSVASQLFWIPVQSTSAALSLWVRGTAAAGTTVTTDSQESSGLLAERLAAADARAPATPLDLDPAHGGPRRLSRAGGRASLEHARRYRHLALGR